MKHQTVREVDKVVKGKCLFGLILAISLFLIPSTPIFGDCSLKITSGVTALVYFQNEFVGSVSPSSDLRLSIKKPGKWIVEIRAQGSPLLHREEVVVSASFDTQKAIAAFSQEPLGNRSSFAPSPQTPKRPRSGTPAKVTHLSSKNSSKYSCFNKGSLKDGVVYVFPYDTSLPKGAQFQQERVRLIRVAFETAMEAVKLQARFHFFASDWIGCLSMGWYTPSDFKKKYEMLKCWQQFGTFQRILKKDRINTRGSQFPARVFEKSFYNDPIPFASFFLKDRAMPILLSKQEFESIVSQGNKIPSNAWRTTFYVGEIGKKVLEVIARSPGQSSIIFSPVSCSVLFHKYKFSSSDGFNPCIYEFDGREIDF